MEGRKDTEHMNQNLYLISGLMLFFESIIATCPVPHELLQSSAAAPAELQISFKYLHRILSHLNSACNNLHKVNKAAILQSDKTIYSDCSNLVLLKGNKEKTLALTKTPAVVCHLLSFIREHQKGNEVGNYFSF